MEPAEAAEWRIAARHLVTGDAWSPVRHKITGDPYMSEITTYLKPSDTTLLRP